MDTAGKLQQEEAEAAEEDDEKEGSRDQQPFALQPLPPVLLVQELAVICAAAAGYMGVAWPGSAAAGKMMEHCRCRAREKEREDWEKGSNSTEG